MEVLSPGGVGSGCRFGVSVDLGGVGCVCVGFSGG